jgi:DNA polymerase III delta prime subunit
VEDQTMPSWNKTKLSKMIEDVAALSHRKESISDERSDLLKNRQWADEILRRFQRTKKKKVTMYEQEATPRDQEVKEAHEVFDRIKSINARFKEVANEHTAKSASLQRLLLFLRRKGVTDRLVLDNLEQTPPM